MSNEINLFHQSGFTAYAVLENSAGQKWNTSSEAWETFNASNWTDYDISLTEQGTSGIYLGDFPSAITAAGTYRYYTYRQDGASPAQGDTRLGSGTVDWTGSAVAGATVGSMTGSDFYNYLLRKGFERTDKSTEVYEAITDAVQIMRRKFNFDEAEAETTTTDTISTDGDYQISLESDNGMLMGIQVEDGTDAWSLTGVSNSIFNKMYPDIAVTTSRGTPKHYTVVAGSIKVGYVPDKTTYVFRIYYSQRAGTVTSSTATVPFTALYRDVLADCALWLLYKSLEHYQKAQYHEEQFERRFLEATTQETKNSNKSTFAVRYNDI